MGSSLPSLPSPTNILLDIRYRKKSIDVWYRQSIDPLPIFCFGPATSLNQFSYHHEFHKLLMLTYTRVYGCITVFTYLQQATRSNLSAWNFRRGPFAAATHMPCYLADLADGYTQELQESEVQLLINSGDLIISTTSTANWSKFWDPQGLFVFLSISWMGSLQIDW